MQSLERFFTLLWLLFLFAMAMWAAMTLGAYAVREWLGGPAWLAALLTLAVAYFMLLGVRLVHIARHLVLGNITPRLARRDVRTILSNLAFFAKTGMPRTK